VKAGEEYLELLVAPTVSCRIVYEYADTWGLWHARATLAPNYDAAKRFREDMQAGPTKTRNMVIQISIASQWVDVLKLDP
jgi:hypothetical protein